MEYFVEPLLPGASNSKHRFFITQSRTGFEVLFNVTVNLTQEGKIAVRYEGSVEHKLRKTFASFGKDVGTMFRRSTGCDMTRGHHCNPFFTPGMIIQVDTFVNPPTKEGGFLSDQEFFISEFGLVPLDATFIDEVVNAGGVEHGAAGKIVESILKGMKHFYDQPNQFPA